MNWDTETDIRKLLGFAKPTKRQLTLFAINCCKEILHLMDDQRSKDAVIVAELFADNKITTNELEIARNNAWRAYFASDTNTAAAFYVANVTIDANAANVAYITTVNPNSKTKQLEILKDIINPNLPILNPNTLTYNNSIITKLAKSIYNSQNYQDLPILADALEDAHEYNPILLNHLRSDQTHYKGCWGLDLLRSEP